MGSWFEELCGFREESPELVRENISVRDNLLTSRVNGRQFVHGVLETPSLADLRQLVQAEPIKRGTRAVSEIIADAQYLHADTANAGSLFQVASQFNLLEMVSPGITPEQGVGRYEFDPTQGPACAVAAGAGTIYRNYFVELKGKKGQSKDNQIDCLADIGRALGNRNNRLWEMKNGYALANEKGLAEIAKILESSSEEEIDELRKLLRVGLHWNTEVTLPGSGHQVSQAYCSALPVAYSHCSSELWSAFAQLILEASYEATICAGILNYLNNGNNKLFLTLIGGGAFGNRQEWIINALYRALSMYRHVGLDIMIVSHGRSQQCVRDLIQRLDDNTSGS